MVAYDRQLAGRWHVTLSGMWNADDFPHLAVSRYCIGCSSDEKTRPERRAGLFGNSICRTGAPGSNSGEQRMTVTCLLIIKGSDAGAVRSIAARDHLCVLAVQSLS